MGEEGEKELIDTFILDDIAKQYEAEIDNLKRDHKKEIDDKTLDRIEEYLIQSDVGVVAAAEIKEIISDSKIDPKKDIADEIKAYQDELARDAENTTLARFIRNLESRIYAELSRQLVNNLFGDTESTEGVLSLEGNTIQYSISDGMITLTITDANGNVTTITLPVGDFYF